MQLQRRRTERLLTLAPPFFDINVLAYRSRPNVAEDQVPSRFANCGMSACRGWSGGGCWGGEKGEAEEGGVSVARDFAGELDNHDAVYGGYCLCDLSSGSVATGRARGSTGCFESIKDILLIRLWRGVVSICGGGPQNSPTAASRETSPTSAIRFRPLRSGSLPLRR